MKKLFLWAALAMTGFAFYSCDDVVDNPAQDSSSKWNYSVSVTFADFDFGELTYAYEAPKTLYVFNEDMQAMGTISTDVAPAAGGTATYSGTLTGSIGNNLIITTKTGADFSKQDGTIESIIENAIVQTDTVAIKIYNAMSEKISTASAKLKNNIAIAHLATWSLVGGDEITITASDTDESLVFTLSEEEFDGLSASNFYVAIPASTNNDTQYTITSNKANGYTVGTTIDPENYTFTLGKVNNADIYGNAYWPAFENMGVDLTIWDAKWRADGNTGIHTLWGWINADKSFVITQSGEETLDSVNVSIQGNQDADVAATINNIRLGKDRYFGIYNGANVALTLVGENEFGILTLNTPFTKQGDGTWKFEQLNIGGSMYWDGTQNVVAYAAEYTIDEDLNLKHLSSSNGAKLTIADGKKVSVVNENGTAISVYRATFNIGKGATLQAESKVKSNSVINIEGADFNVGENAIVSAQGYKDGYAMYIYNYYNGDYNQKVNVNIGKNATVTLIGGPEDILGRGMYIYNRYNATTNITLDEGATLNATGIDRQGIYCDTYNGNSNYEENNSVNFKIAKGAKITAEDTADGQAFYAYVWGGKINFDGEGTLEAKSNGNYGIYLTNSSNLFFNGGNIIAIGGKDQPAINGNTFTIGENITSFKAQKGADATLYISNWGSETQLENLVADKTKFNDEIADGVRTITPKPAEAEEE